MSDDKYTRLHNKGEQDAAKGKYDPPNGAISELLFGSDPKENAAYSAGRTNAKAQMDAAKGKYEPTGDEKTYKEVWRAAKDNMR